MVEGTAPTYAKEATVYIGGSSHGYAKGVKIGVQVGLVKDYSIDDQDPAILKPGNRSYPISIDSLFIDSTKANLVLAGAPVDLAVTPEGGLKYTIDDVVLSDWELTVTDPGALLQKVSGEGVSLTIASA